MNNSLRIMPGLRRKQFETFARPRARRLGSVMRTRPRERGSHLDTSSARLVRSALLGMYGALLNLAPVEFAEATGIYIACLFVMFQVVNYLFFRALPTPGVLLGGAFIV